MNYRPILARCQKKVGLGNSFGTVQPMFGFILHCGILSQSLIDPQE
jgi:hypothetical protein